jgi:ribonuclease HII
VAAVCVLNHPDPSLLPGLDDSKKLTPDRREAVYQLLHDQLGRAVAGFGIGMATAAEIDATDILRATQLAATRALRQIPVWPRLLLTDALTLPGPVWTGRQVPLVRGDGRCLAIAAASVLAKVTRDRYMARMAEQYPGYGFERHAGYPTPSHYAALEALGPCPIHRQSFLRGRRK